MESQNRTDELKYLRAKKRVKQIKGFYIHLAIFIAVNAFIVLSKFLIKEDYEPGNIWGMGMWAFGLTVHGLSVFLPAFLFGNDWEERKIKEVMDKNRRQYP